VFVFVESEALFVVVLGFSGHEHLLTY